MRCIILLLCVLFASCGPKHDGEGRSGVVKAKSYIQASGGFGKPTDRFYSGPSPERWQLTILSDQTKAETWFPVDSTTYHKYEVGDRYP